MIGALSNIFKAISEGFKFGQVIADADQKDKRFTVRMRKNARECLNVAEDMMLFWDMHIHLLPLKDQRVYRKYKKKFNELD